MIYHQLGYIPQHQYKGLKKIVKRWVFREVSKRKLLPARTSYEHERARVFGEIWAEDFTHLRVCGKKFYAALVIDVAMPHYLGATVNSRPDDTMVKDPNWIPSLNNQWQMNGWKEMENHGLNIEGRCVLGCSDST